MTSLADLLKNRGKTLTDLATALRVNKATVSRWNKKGVPPERIADIERETGIAAVDQRPDLARVFLKSEDAAQ